MDKSQYMKETNSFLSFFSFFFCSLGLEEKEKL
jgi:hypothetical protein